MTPEPIRTGAILAAGEGSRLKEGGWTVSKPLVPVAGVPLVGHVLANFAAAGIRNVTILFNESENDCARWTREHFGDLDLTVLQKTTASSYESFREIAARLPSGPALFSTVDAWCPRGDFLRFARAAQMALAETTLLAVTPFIRDEKPLRADLDGQGRVTGLGGQEGRVVTAGMYVFPERVRGLSPPPTVLRLREFLIWLERRGEKIEGFSIPTVIDVDETADVALAEALAVEGRGATAVPAARGGP